jgi:hypothetical protein
MIALEQRRNSDNRSLGELFYFFTGELADITFGESFMLILNMMVESVMAVMHPTDDQIKLILEMFIGKLTEYLQSSLVRAVTAA